MGKTFTKYRQIRRKFDAETGTVATVERVTIDRGNVSPEAKANRARAGKANLAKWKAEQAANPPDRSTEQAVSAFRAAFARDVGDSPTVSEVILLEGATATFVALRMCIAKLKRPKNSFDETLRLTHEIATLQKQLLKTTATLELRKASTAPPTIADLILESKRLRSADDVPEESPEDDDDVELEEPEAEKPA
jgi:hypothetical protein